ncbi:hypothetical protein BCR39DRAFT_558076 [Naematelia encephala]|uniref:Hyaluronan-mediated motility receptor C-terminal domain-containing protein n=1 Tax=Naematelia encephala TaxID=71784 RepID=A0A1Y2B9R4_9TREE|nr:hypothetical protein BCR39DRAFT_558076 [Naematelia encephala]
MTTRYPLGDTKVSNIPTTPPGKVVKGDAERKYKKALGDVLDEKRKRAEAEGLATAAKRDKDVAGQEIDRLKKELLRAKEKINRRDEKSTALGQTGSAPSGSGDPESKLQALVQKHMDSKEKHASEVAILKAENKELKASVAASKSSHTKHLEALRQHHSELEFENKRLQRELGDIQTAQVGSSRQAGKWEEERAKRRGLEKELDEIKVELAKAIENRHSVEILKLKVSDLEEQKEHLETILEDSAEAYARLYHSSVRRTEHERICRLYDAERRAREDAKVLAGSLKMELKMAQGQVQDLSIRLHEVEHDRDEAESTMNELLEDRRFSRLEAISHRPVQDMTPPLEPVTVLDVLPFVDLVLSHSDIQATYLSRYLGDVQAAHRDLLSTHDSSLSELTSARTTLTALQRSHAELSTSHDAIQSAHAPCASIIAGLKNDLTHAQIGEDTAKQVIEETKAEMRTVEERAKSDREALKRANETVGRVKMAESAMVDEIEFLKDAVDRAQQYEELYEALLERHRILQSREAIAQEEVERIGHQNAELMGHTNGDQKISYIEILRREMALVKQELAGTRHMLNKANDQVRSLEEECEAYKAIDSVSVLGVSSRTRLVRRQPEGSNLVESMAASARGRSVSGPAGRR